MLNFVQILSLFTRFSSLNIFKTVLISCQYLKSIKILHDDLTESEIYETIAKYSSDDFCELKTFGSSISLESLESFFISWKNRIPKKLLKLIFINYNNRNEEKMKIIEKYENLGIIKFGTQSILDDDYEEKNILGSYVFCLLLFIIYSIYFS